VSWRRGGRVSDKVTTVADTVALIMVNYGSLPCGVLMCGGAGWCVSVTV
jgi:hypothetical protein